MLNSEELHIQEKADKVQNRYCLTSDILPREVVLLKSSYCSWRKCTFCDYWADGSTNPQTLDRVNHEVLSKVTGETGVLEIINSGSFFELPQQHIDLIKDIIREKNIHTFVYECHYMYQDQVEAFNKSLGVKKVITKTGLETYDDSFREDVLNKGFAEKLDHKTFHSTFNGVNILVGLKGQSIEMVARDLEIATKHMDLVLINIFSPNAHDVEIDKDLIEDFYKILPQYTGPNLVVYDHKNAVGLG